MNTAPCVQTHGVHRVWVFQLLGKKAGRLGTMFRQRSPVILTLQRRTPGAAGARFRRTCPAARSTVGRWPSAITPFRAGCFALPRLALPEWRECHSRALWAWPGLSVTWIFPSAHSRSSSPFHRCWSYQHHLGSILHTQVHLRVCFLKHLPGAI